MLRRSACTCVLFSGDGKHGVGLAEALFHYFAEEQLDSEQPCICLAAGQGRCTASVVTSACRR